MDYSLEEYHLMIIQTHIYRFRQQYSGYFEKEKTKKLVNYFFNHIYTLEGKAERDQMAEETYARFRGIISEKSRNRIDKLLKLNSLTDELDQEMALEWINDRELSKKIEYWKVIPCDTMKDLFKRANSFKKREKQLQLSIINLESFFELSKNPIAEMVLKPTKMAAMMIGVRKLYEMFEEGYYATKPVDKELFKVFMNEVREKESNFLSSVYDKEVELPESFIK